MSALESESGRRSRFWYGRKRTVSSTSSRSASATICVWRAPKPAIDDADVRAVAEERRRADEAVEVLRVTHVARVHDDEAADEPVALRPLVVARLRRDRARVDPVRDHAQALRRRALRLEPLPHRLADRDDAVGAAQVGTDEPAQDADHGGVPQPVELGRDLRKDVLADDEHRRADPLADEHAEVADDRRVGHAEHEIGLARRERMAECETEVREVVHRAAAQLRALVRRRRHARDDHAVVLELPRLVLVAVEDAGHDLDLVVLRERLAELRQEVRGRLDAGPVVLVEDEDSLAFAAVVPRAAG